MFIRFAHPSACSSRDENTTLDREAAKVLERGCAREAAQRAPLKEIAAALSELFGEPAPPPAAPPARFWTEGQTVRFRERDYRIVSRLGSGGVGATFKVVEIDRNTKDELGTYVAKVAYDAATGERALKAYRIARSHLRHSALSSIFEVANEWQENQFVALMTWITGVPLSEYIGVFPLLVEEQQELSSEALALRWLQNTCRGLDALHRNGLVHGDVSPRNLILSEGDLILTDYDFVSKIGEPIEAPGTVLYCSPSCEGRYPASVADDIYALAASFFHVVFEKEPFLWDGNLDKNRGLNWEGVNRDDCLMLAESLDRATSPDPSRRFRDVAEALAALKVTQPAEASSMEAISEATPPDANARPARAEGEDRPAELREQRVDWLRSVLQSYPGSRWGNTETRGLDSDFAIQTYVETELEQQLVHDIRELRVRLVVLCGNAGDGKTALLQHLAYRLGLGTPKSADRMVEGQVFDGPLVRINLDGSASWRGRSADEILDEFLAPFRDGSPARDVVHLLAINDGRLLEWIGKNAETPLKTTLDELLQDIDTSAQGAAAQPSYIRLISLNERSLVGGVTLDHKGIDTAFLDCLLDQLYGGKHASEIWAPCHTCSAKDRCEVFRAAQYFAPHNRSNPAQDKLIKRCRERLSETLQAIHFRGETHITMRELRATMVYILFGSHFCDDYHAGPEGAALPYWDRAFSANSPFRQGELLHELIRFDPALEAHPQIDRYLLGTPPEDTSRNPPHYQGLTLASARRRAFFEWTPEAIEQVTGDRNALDLARGRHLRRFRALPLADEHELANVCELLCRGVSRLEDLPPQALDRHGVIPLRVTPRTPTETAFWVEKPLAAFRLKANLPREAQGIERLHCEAFLIYRYSSGHHEERLRLGAELFAVLLDLAEGYQLGDVSADDTFAHLSIFAQRLIREDERTIFAWSPMRDETIYRLSVETRVSEGGPRQLIAVGKIPMGA
jgi:serine/threonine protein kinase